MRTLDRLLYAETLHRPDATAVAYEDEILTFRELSEGALVLAQYLRSLGAAADTRVGVHIEPSLELVTATWGTLCSGAAYVPLSPEYPEERVRYMVEDSAARIVLTQDHLRARVTDLSPPGTTVVTLGDAVRHAWRTAGEEPEAYDIRETDLAYVIYTSGSTGRPKGVMVEHRSLAAQMRWLAAEHRLAPGAVVLQKTPMSFDAAQWEILAPAVGARVAVGPPGVYRDPEALIDTIRTHRATMLQGVPTLLQALVDTERLASCTTLRRVYSGGEILSRNLAAQLLAELPAAELINLYGPTECTINASSHTVDRATVCDPTGPAASTAIPIGRPAYGTTFHIRDGELCIGGVQVARGYLDRPELTAERFITTDSGERLYRTGDLAHWNEDGTVQFAGRADNQIKLRGFRVELDEIALAIENHDWVKNAAVIVKDEPRTGFQNLVACVELSPKEAALMDQGNHGAHHQSKESKLQVKAQLSNAGTRPDADLAGLPTVVLAGSTPTDRMRRTVFARKTYRFYEGGEATRADILAALARRPEGIGSRAVGSLTAADLGEVLRWCGQFTSEERLLPKYGYASPGALYATQLYVELRGIAGLEPGTYYYHPVRHQLYRTGEGTPGDTPLLRFAFQGLRSAIEPVYRNNIQEVLEIETGHMVGLFEEVLPGYGLDIRPYGEGDGSFEVVPYDEESRTAPEVDVYVQSHGTRVADLPEGQYAYVQGDLRQISSDLVEKKHVIAINQAVYGRASFGITVISRTAATNRAYIDLGRALQRLQLGGHGLGFMPSGYGSKSGRPLPSARRVDEILAAAGRPAGPSYFFVGGRVSEEQRLSEGMYEDTVHMKGPAEMIRDDLVHHLPDYMIPNRVVVLDRLPLSANGKVDTKALGELAVVNAGLHGRPHVRPRTRTESRLTEIWSAALKYEDVEAVSVLDDFFESGGNSLIAVALVTRINREFGARLPLQILFDRPTIEKLAHRLDGAAAAPASRLVRLHAAGAQPPVYCWPGLGGYTMNLRHLADEIGIDRPFYGVQAYGINRGEEPYATIREMAAADVEAIRRRRPTGPYTLWGYSFGARVAFESAHLLEAAGEQVENLFLIAPGSPKVRSSRTGGANYENPAFVTILYSVFAGVVDPTVEAADRESFVKRVAADFPALEEDLIGRIVSIVEETFEFTYTFRELSERQVKGPVTIFKASGDDYSFLENTAGWSTRPPTVVELDADHYSLLRQPDLKELVKKIRYRLGQ
ncbi:amino acid adenylation domain-containing protein [Streptomyces sp. NBC_00250]|uniref:non-ribosomal peptide synthetase family protein n=1 Tax=Streptomyces sp. NBC_00250 TaxID=2903641 RepID=UPI002E2BA193|nr:amino acid adenylation domain-containing protein [Streptomyces sp. NBC_00250]